jgi:hypothetical protein
MEVFRLLDLCKADLRAAGIDDPRLDYDQQLSVEHICQEQVIAAQNQAELARMQRLYAENQILIAAREIQSRRNREGAGAVIGDR